MKSVRGYDLKVGKVSSCGCLISKGEEETRNVLNSLHINFDTQYHFEDLRSDKGRYLKFDFAILGTNNNLKCLIEYQGIQHYDDNRGYFGKQQREITDVQKRNYCLENNIPLFEIAYNENIEKRVKEILPSIDLLAV